MTGINSTLVELLENELFWIEFNVALVDPKQNHPRCNSRCIEKLENISKSHLSLNYFKHRQSIFEHTEIQLLISK